MGFVDYLSRHPSGEPVPVSYDDKKIVSVNQISTLLGFEHLMPRYSRSQLGNKLWQQTLFHDTIYCNANGQSANNMTSQEIQREKRIANAAEHLQAIFTHSKISVCQNLHSPTEDCIRSLKVIDFYINYKSLKDMSDRFELTEQPQYSTVEN